MMRGVKRVLALVLAVVVLGAAVLSTPSGQRALASAAGEKFEFQAEVSRLMDIIINSLYAEKDALDRIRYLAVKDDAQLGEGEARELEVRISIDKESRTLTVRDRGVGMTREDLTKNLGTVARSGTTAFVEAMAGGQGDLSMIGQFGVGFYAVYLAADKVVVSSKHNDDPDQWVWTSQADSTFNVHKDPEGNTLGRGTSVTLHVKDDADEYLDEARIEEIVRRYSEFISYPIYLRKSKQETVPDEEAEVPEPAEGEEAPERPTKTITSWSWERVNDQPAIWTRPKEDITDEEYTAFYKATSKDWAEPLTWTHFRAEGEIEFKSILYVPRMAPPSFYDNYYGKSGSLKLYVRRVMIADEFEDFMPRYLSFIKGVVDSDDLPLNVSREQLQQHKILRVIAKKLVRKVLELLKQLSDDDVEARKKIRESAASADGGELDEESSEEETKFATLWKAFGKSVKLGVIEDSANRNRLVKLLRFVTTRHGVSTLEEYVERMPSWQTSIFFVAGHDLEELRKSPFLERAAAKGVEVLLLGEPLDEYVVQNLPDFEGKRLQNLAKEGIKFGDESSEDRAREKHYKERFAALCSWMKTLFGDQVEKVVVSSRVVDTPSVIVTSQFGHSANMERIMRHQTMNDPERAKYMLAKKTMEVNPRHPIIAELARRAEGERTQLADDLAWLLFDVARLNSGFEIEKPQVFSARVFRLMKQGLDLSSLDLMPEADVPAEEEQLHKGSGEETADVVDLDDGAKEEL